MFGLTKDDVKFLATHIFIFFIAYTSMMSSIKPVGNTNIPIFDWQAVSAGLLAAGGTTIGSKLKKTNTENTSVVIPDEIKKSELTPEVKEVK